MLQVIRLAIGVGSAAIILRYFGPSLRGVLAIATSVLGAVSVISFQTSQALQTFVPKLERDGHPASIRSLLWRVYGLRALSVAMVSAGLAMVTKAAAGFYGLVELESLLMVLSVTNLASLLGGPVDFHALIAFRWYRHAMIHGLLDVLGAVTSAVCTVAFDLGLDGYLWTLAIGPALSSCYGWYCFRQIAQVYNWTGQAPQSPLAGIGLRRLLGFGAPITVMSMLNQVAPHLGTLVAGKVFSTTIVGLYSFAATTTGRIWSVISMPETAVLPKFAQALVAGPRAVADVLNRSSRAILAYAAVTTTLVAVFAREITTILAGHEFLAAVPLLQVLAVHAIFRSLEVSRFVFYVAEQPGKVLTRFVVKLVVEIGCIAILAPRVGVLGLALAYVLSFIVWGVLIAVSAYASLFTERAETLRWISGNLGAVVAVTVLAAAAAGTGALVESRAWGVEATVVAKTVAALVLGVGAAILSVGGIGPLLHLLPKPLAAAIHR